jgi:hypothetical protein
MDSLVDIYVLLNKIPGFLGQREIINEIVIADAESCPETDAS